MTLLKLALAAVLLGVPVAADTLPQMDGPWRGSGWARETAQGPQEAVRCQISNSYDEAALTLTVAGQCVVPGRRLDIAGTLTGTQGEARITGSWANPDGAGRARVVGVQGDGFVAFNFNATDPASGETLAQNVEWRFVDGALRLRSTDRDDPDIMMSDITFER